MAPLKVPLDRSYRKLLVVETTVYSPGEDRFVSLVAAVDTGASSTMIPVETALRLGYDLGSAPRGRVVTGEGVVYAPKITVARLEVGRASATRVETLCHVLPEESVVDALVGLSFLTRFDVSFDFGAWEMELTPRA